MLSCWTVDCVQVWSGLSVSWRARWPLFLLSQGRPSLPQHSQSPVTFQTGLSHFIIYIVRHRQIKWVVKKLITKGWDENNGRKEKPDFHFFMYFIRTNNFRNKCYIKSSSRDIKNPMKQENGCNVLTKKVYS